MAGHDPRRSMAIARALRGSAPPRRGYPERAADIQDELSRYHERAADMADEQRRAAGMPAPVNPDAIRVMPMPDAPVSPGGMPDHGPDVLPVMPRPQRPQALPDVSQLAPLVPPGAFVGSTPDHSPAPEDILAALGQQKQ